MRYINGEFVVPTVVLALLATSLVAAESNENSCDIPIASKQLYRYQWPLAFQTNGELYPTAMTVNKERKVQIENGAEVLLSCGPNYLKNYNRKEVMHVKCNGDSGNFTAVTEKKGRTSAELTIKDLTCDLRVIEEVVTPVAGCTNEKWTSTNFGYVEPTEKVTYILGETCYDMAEGRTHFAHVKLGDKSSNYLQKTDKSFLTKGQHPDGRYKIELFRGLHFDEIYERIRTQLHIKSAPQLKMANFIDETLLSNAQFQAVKKLGWNYYVTHDELEVLDTLKQDIRKLSERLNLDVYVGSHGVHVLHGSTGDELEVYLQLGSRDRFPMPELIWILVKNQQQVSAFAVFNDAANTVDAEDVTHTTQLCRSECEKVTWLTETLRPGVNRRPLVCCSYEELKSVIGTVPKWGDIKEMLI